MFWLKSLVPQLIQVKLCNIYLHKYNYKEAHTYLSNGVNVFSIHNSLCFALTIYFCKYIHIPPLQISPFQSFFRP